jgi:hypothetical protein
MRFSLSLFCFLSLQLGCDGVEKPQEEADAFDCSDEGESDADGLLNCDDVEECDGQDNDGDGAVDEGFDADVDGVPDCDDVEECDGQDNDGDGSIDEGFDSDADGVADCEDVEECDGVDNDGDGDVDEGFDGDSDGIADCEDIEECDGIDNNGDGIIDEGFDSDQDYLPDCLDEEECDGRDNDGDGLIDCADPDVLDSDGDGYCICDDCDDSDALMGLEDADGDGYSSCDGDCDDSDLSVGPGASEVCDGIDNDCDGYSDDADSDVDASTANVIYLDADGDGYGDPAESATACITPAGYVGNADDCNDEDAEISPAAVEICDGMDNDCDTLVDDLDGDVDMASLVSVYPDSDGDGYGDDALAESTCSLPIGYAFDGGDCDDGEAGISPAAEEVCDGLDNDCDVDTDESLDGDGDSQSICDGDCDDFDETTYTGAEESCDGLDNDCDGSVPTEESDSDGDGYMDCVGLTCSTYGMTWALNDYDAALGVSKVGCSNCDPYRGDHDCNDSIPILCIQMAGLPNPGVGSSDWSGGYIDITDPVQGCALTSITAADAICADRFGSGWRMAEFHDANAWALWGEGEIPYEWTCNDGIDDDGDGLTDCDDSDCVDEGSCDETDCTDGVDDDGDGLLDCDDPDCMADSSCAAYSYEVDCVEGSSNEADLDDDGDGLLNCDDPDCSESSVCIDDRRYWTYINDQAAGNCWN